MVTKRLGHMADASRAAPCDAVAAARARWAVMACEDSSSVAATCRPVPLSPAELTSAGSGPSSMPRSAPRTALLGTKQTPRGADLRAPPAPVFGGDGDPEPVSEVLPQSDQQRDGSSSALPNWRRPWSPRDAERAAAPRPRPRVQRRLADVRWAFTQECVARREQAAAAFSVWNRWRVGAAMLRRALARWTARWQATAMTRWRRRAQDAALLRRGAACMLHGGHARAVRTWAHRSGVRAAVLARRCKAAAAISRRATRRALNTWCSYAGTHAAAMARLNAAATSLSHRLARLSINTWCSYAGTCAAAMARLNAAARSLSHRLARLSINTWCSYASTRAAAMARLGAAVRSLSHRTARRALNTWCWRAYDANARVSALARLDAAVRSLAPTGRARSKAFRMPRRALWALVARRGNRSWFDDTPPHPMCCQVLGVFACRRRHCCDARPRHSSNETARARSAHGRRSRLAA